MTRYADTCLLLSLIFRDSGTPAALAWLEAADNEPVMISHWAVTEFVSAAGIMARHGDIPAELHRQGLARFRLFVAARLTVEAPSPADFERAAIWMEDYRTALRAGDAMHLAVCARLGCTLCTADESLAMGAAHFGIAVSRVA